MPFTRCADTCARHLLVERGEAPDQRIVAVTRSSGEQELPDGVSADSILMTHNSARLLPRAAKLSPSSGRVFVALLTLEVRVCLAV